MVPDRRVENEETVDDLILDGMKIIQPKRGYRFSLDAVLLAHFASVKGVHTIIDIGTGSGIIPLLMSSRIPDAAIVGIELQEAIAERALRNIILNNKTEQIRIIQGDVREIEQHLPGGFAQLVLSNPPFWRVGEGKLSQNKEEAIARHELYLNLEQLVFGAAYLLEDNGRLALIHRADRMEELLQAFSAARIRPRRIRMIHSYADRNAKLVLLEGQKHGQGQLEILPPLVIYEQQGVYCREIQALYGLNRESRG